MKMPKNTELTDWEQAEHRENAAVHGATSENCGKNPRTWVKTKNATINME